MPIPPDLIEIYGVPLATRGRLLFYSDTADAPALPWASQAVCSPLETSSLDLILLSTSPLAQNHWEALAPSGLLIIPCQHQAALPAWNALSAVVAHWHGQDYWVLRKQPSAEQALHLPSQLSNETFSLQRYHAFLQELQRNNYTSIDYLYDINNLSSLAILLRHDVDFDTQSALDMATLEAQCGFTATYFFMASGRFYNPTSSQHRHCIRAIAEQGHRIGLHYDCNEDFELSKAILQRISGQDVVVASQHDPTIQGIRPPAHQWLNAYDPKHEKAGFVYRSDSGKHWRHEPLEAMLQHKRLHLLLHPELWIHGRIDVVSLVRKATEWRAQQLRDEFSQFAAQQIPYLKASIKPK